MSSPYNYNNNNYTYSYNNNNNNNNNPNNNNNVNQPAENHQHSNPSPFPPAAFPAPPSAPTATPPANNNNNKANFDIQSHYYNMYNNNNHPPPANNHPPNKFTVEGGIEDNPQVLPPTYLAREEVAQQTAREAERHYQQTLQQGGLPPPPSATSHNNNNGRQRLLFVPRSPRYTYRLLFLLAVAFCGALPLLHPLNWMILLTCFIAVYIADFIGSAKATVTLLLSFIALFGASLVITNYSIVVRSVGPMLMIVDLTFLLFTACAAACLHFRFIQVEYPLVTFLLERVALVVMPLLVLPPSLAMCIALGGSRYAPAYFFGIMCLEHHFFYGPLKSSFLYQRLYHLEEPTEGETPTSSDKKNKDTLPHPDYYYDEEEGDVCMPIPVVERGEGIGFTILLFILPICVYHALQSNWLEHFLPNIANTFGFIGAAASYLCVQDVRRSLWFLSPPADATDGLVDKFQEEVRHQARAEGLTSQEEAELAARNSQRMAALKVSYDAFGVLDFFDMFQNVILSIFGAFLSLWGVHRVLTSRLGVLFDGVPKGVNAVFLLIIFYLAVFVAIQTKIILRKDEAAFQKKKLKFIANKLKGKRGAQAAAEAAAMDAEEVTLSDRIPAVVAAAVLLLFLCIVMGAPVVVCVLSVMSIVTLNLFLLDRSNVIPMVYFTALSSLLLMWFMYKSYSFIIMNLQVFGEYSKVPVAYVSMGIVMSHVLGCLSFMSAFSENRRSLVLYLCCHGFQWLWVERVLLSQEEAYYPVWLAGMTTAAMLLVCHQLYRNRVLTPFPACLIAALHMVKWYTFIVSETSARYFAAEQFFLVSEETARQAAFRAYLKERDAEDRHRFMKSMYPNYTGTLTSTTATSTTTTVAPSTFLTKGKTSVSTSAVFLTCELNIGWWAAWAAVTLALLLEVSLRRVRRGVTPAVDVPTSALVPLYMALSAVVAACTVRNVQRRVYELLTDSYVDTKELYHIAPGNICVAFTLAVFPVLWRYRTLLPEVSSFYLPAVKGVAVVGALWLLVQPSRHDEEEQTVDHTGEVLPHRDLGRVFTFVGLTLLVLARALVPFLRRHIPSTVAGGNLVLFAFVFPYLLLVSCALAIAVMTQCISVFSVVLFVLLSLAFLLLFALVWVTHYKEVTSFETLLAPDGREGNTRGSQNKQSLIRTGVMLYGLFVFVLTLSYLESWRVQRTWEGTTTLDERFPLEYQMVRQKSQISFIAVGCAMNLFLLLLLKFRTAGYALLPSAVRARGGAQQESVLILSPAVLQLCHVIGNFCVMYVFGALVAVQFFFRNMDHGGNNSERMTGASLQVVLSCVLLLLLSNDDFLFRKLSRSERRYAPVLGMMFLWLAVGALQRAWTSASYLPLPYRIQETAFTALYCVLNLPSQLAAQSYLLRPSKGEPSIAYAPKTVLVTVVLSLIPLFFSGNPYVMWGSLISIAAHACRLYSAQFNTSKRRRM